MPPYFDPIVFVGVGASYGLIQGHISIGKEGDLGGGVMGRAGIAIELTSASDGGFGAELEIGDRVGAGRLAAHFTALATAGSDGLLLGGFRYRMSNVVGFGLDAGIHDGTSMVRAGVGLDGPAGAGAIAVVGLLVLAFVGLAGAH